VRFPRGERVFRGWSTAAAAARDRDNSPRRLGGQMPVGHERSRPTRPSGPGCLSYSDGLDYGGLRNTSPEAVVEPDSVACCAERRDDSRLRLTDMSHHQPFGVLGPALADRGYDLEMLVGGSLAVNPEAETEVERSLKAV